MTNKNRLPNTVLLILVLATVYLLLGIAGVAGNGQKELAEVLTGNRKSTAGKININNDVMSIT